MADTAKHEIGNGDCAENTPSCLLGCSVLSLGHSLEVIVVPCPALDAGGLLSHTPALTPLEALVVALLISTWFPSPAALLEQNLK